MVMREYKARIKHDGGTFTMDLKAATYEAAVDQIMESEGCPRRAITSLKAVDKVFGSVTWEGVQYPTRVVYDPAIQCDLVFAPENVQVNLLAPFDSDQTYVSDAAMTFDEGIAFYCTEEALSKLTDHALLKLIQ